MRGATEGYRCASGGAPVRLRRRRGSAVAAMGLEVAHNQALAELRQRLAGKVFGKPASERGHSCSRVHSTHARTAMSALRSGFAEGLLGWDRLQIDREARGAVGSKSIF